MTEKAENRELLLTKIKLVLIMVVFGLPLLAAMIMAHLSRDGLPIFVGTTNHGDLVVPVYKLTDLNVPSYTEGDITVDSFNELWTLVFVAENGCDQACQDQVFAMRQLRLMNGREADRVQRLFIYHGLSEEEQQSVHDAFPHMLMGKADAQQMQEVTTLFRRKGHDDPLRLYLVDPVGNLMMSFPGDMNPRQIYFDMKKLLKVTK